MLFAGLLFFISLAVAILVLFLIAAQYALPPNPPPAGPKGPVLLTIAGAIGKTNRGAVSPQDETLFAERKISFGSAYEYDEAMLKKMTPSIPPENNAGYAGPLLNDILADVEAKGALIHAHGLTKSFFIDRENKNWTVALAASRSAWAGAGRSCSCTRRPTLIPAHGLLGCFSSR